MIIVLDTAQGQAFNFKTRREAGEFIGVSRPTLREWLKSPFYLHKSLIITHTSNEKVEESRKALFEIKTKILGRDFHADQSRPINGSGKEETPVMERG